MSRTYPVIHVIDVAQAQRNLEIAIEAMADGAFLINHGVGPGDLKGVLDTARQTFPDFWIGVNYLGLPPNRAALVYAPAQGLWMDGYPQKPLGLPVPVLGGVGFKYMRNDLTLEEEVKRAAPCVDVLVTSGSATGETADLAKVQRLHELAEGKHIGIASGLTPDNVQEYKPYAEWLLVATGISHDFHTLDLAKAKAFVEAAR